MPATMTNVKYKLVHATTTISRMFSGFLGTFYGKLITGPQHSPTVSCFTVDR